MGLGRRCLLSRCSFFTPVGVIPCVCVCVASRCCGHDHVVCVLLVWYAPLHHAQTVFYPCYPCMFFYPGVEECVESAVGRRLCFRLDLYIDAEQKWQFRNLTIAERPECRALLERTFDPNSVLTEIPSSRPINACLRLFPRQLGSMEYLGGIQRRHRLVFACHWRALRWV